MGGEHSRYEGTLCAFSYVGWLDNSVPGSRQAHDRHGRPDLRNYRPRLERCPSAGRARIQIADKHRLVTRPHLLHGYSRGLQGRPRIAGPMQISTAERIREVLYAT